MSAATKHHPSPASPHTTRVTRIEVWPRPEAGDPRADAVIRGGAQLAINIARAATARVYLIEGALPDDAIERIASGLLTNAVVETAVIGTRDAATPTTHTIEVHPLPGVMDPVAQTVHDSIIELLAHDQPGLNLRITTGFRYDLEGIDDAHARLLAKRLLANAVVEQVHFEPWTPDAFPEARIADQTLRHVTISTLDAPALEKLSREGHLFLSLEEMQAIQAHFRELGREPTDVELETLAQTWSEHCVHKTLKSRVTYRPQGHTLKDDVIDWSARPGHTLNPDGTVTIDNLLKSTVAAATHELIADGLDWALSVFVDNAGIIAFDEHNAVCMKVETHNRPSAIEPYGGAATGIGGCIRDIMGTGLAAKPIANTDVFCVAHPDHFFTADQGGTGLRPVSGSQSQQPLPTGCLHPRRILSRVVDGVRDYGNRMGIPTVNGGVYFDDRYVGNPLVFAGCVGVMPRDKTAGDANPGDLIVALGGRTGRDGIHGATFSSAELTDTHADEFAHAVQIGNAIEEKRVLDAILRARDFVVGEAPGTRDKGPGSPECLMPDAWCLYSAITDCGAGGFSSAVGEMGETIGATVDLDKAPLKYAGLRYDEIWISESQERMVLAVPEHNLAALQQICDEEHVELAVLGTFGNTDDTGAPQLLLRYDNTEVARLPMPFLHDGIPMPTREAVWASGGPARRAGSPTDPPEAAQETRLGEPCHRRTEPLDIKATLLKLLAHPNIASKRWIVNQYDHEVQGNTIIKPLVGPGGIGPGDAAVIEPVPGSGRGLAIANGLQTRLGHPDVEGADPYLMALAAVDECVRNLVCVGADPSRIAILDNFCWASCNKPENMASLVRAAEGCYDAAKAYRTPFISGKDSLNNQFRTDDGRTIEIPPTLLISGVGIVPDAKKCVTMDLKADGGPLLHISTGATKLAGSHVESVTGSRSNDRIAPVDLASCVATARFVHELIREGHIVAAHDCSEGGPLVAIAEMLIASSEVASHRFGVTIDFDGLDVGAGERAFAEGPGGYIVQMRAGLDEWEFVDDLVLKLERLLGLDKWDVSMQWFGESSSEPTLRLDNWPSQPAPIPVAELCAAFLGTLDW